MTHREITQDTGSVSRALGEREPLSLSRIPLSWRLALLYLAAITLAEALTILVESWLGLALYSLILLALLIQGSLGSRRTHRFLLALALAPLLRLLSLALPPLNIPLVYWYLLVGVPLFLAAFYTARAGQLSRKMIGLTGRKLPFQVLIGLTGIGLGYLEYRILRPEPLVAELRLELVWLPALILLAFTGLLEELIFRGLLQYTSLPSLGRVGLLYTAVVFTVLHIGYRSWLDLAFILLVSLFFAWAVQRSGSILGATISHGLINISLFLIFPFLLAAPATVTNEPQAIEPAAPVLLAPVQSVPTPLPDQPLPALIQPIIVTPPPTLTPIATEAPASEAPTVPPSVTPTATSCGPPAGWEQYTVQSGDRLGPLAKMFGVSREKLRLANCLDSNDLKIGQLLWVPFLPAEPTKVIASPWPTQVQATSTPLPTDPPTLPPPLPTSTELPIQPPASPTPQPTQAPLPTPTEAPTLPTPPPPTATEDPTEPPPPTPTEEPPPTPTEAPTLPPPDPILTKEPLG